MPFHVLNRAVARLTLFEKPEDYEAFERVLAEAHQRVPLPIFAYAVTGRSPVRVSGVPT